MKANMPDSGDRAPNVADETLLVERLRGGHEDAFEALVRTYGGRMLAVARRILRDEDHARDAVQDAFLSAFKSIGLPERSTLRSRESGLT